MKTILLYFKEKYSRLMNIHGEPKPVALGYALGTFLAASPLMGIHCILAVSLAGALKWNRLAAGIGAFNSNLLTAPMLYCTTYFIGAKILGLKEVLIIPSKPVEMLSKGSDVIMALMLGGIILGVPLAVCGYYFSFFMVKRYRLIRTLKSNSHATKS
jgi:uncharacterized protein (DUF2062 family)